MTSWAAWRCNSRIVREVGTLGPNFDYGRAAEYRIGQLGDFDRITGF
jgi:hypothetical protein